MLISPEYVQQQKQMHNTYEYGTASLTYAPMVAKVMNQNGVKTLLDYGAGRMNLLRAISDRKLVDHAFEYIPYEPAHEKHCEPPAPAEMVACIDVLEHIEPDCLDAVLDDLKRVTQAIGFFTVATGPAAKLLPDGRNAHLIQEPPEWWLPKILARFDLFTFQRTPGGFAVAVVAKDLP